MNIVRLETPAFARRDQDMICWRVSAIYRCCLRLGMDKAWALKKLREISPEGHRDHMADVWFMNIEDLRRRYFSGDEDLLDPASVTIAA
jgi:hypothetical protein